LSAAVVVLENSILKIPSVYNSILKQKDPDSAMNFWWKGRQREKRRLCEWIVVKRRNDVVIVTGFMRNQVFKTCH
jgi:hypothetical protein